MWDLFKSLELCEVLKLLALLAVELVGQSYSGQRGCSTGLETNLEPG